MNKHQPNHPWRKTPLMLSGNAPAKHVDSELVRARKSADRKRRWRARTKQGAEPAEDAAQESEP